jgi:hypothetical protein
MSTEDDPPMVMSSKIARSIFPNPLLMTAQPAPSNAGLAGWRPTMAAGVIERVREITDPVEMLEAFEARERAAGSTQGHPEK